MGAGRAGGRLRRRRASRRRRRPRDSPLRGPALAPPVLLRAPAFAAACAAGCMASVAPLPRRPAADRTRRCAAPPLQDADHAAAAAHARGAAVRSGQHAAALPPLHGGAQERRGIHHRGALSRAAAGQRRQRAACTCACPLCACTQRRRPCMPGLMPCGYVAIRLCSADVRLQLHVADKVAAAADAEHCRAAPVAAARRPRWLGSAACSTARQT